ncbi:pyridoxamine 5'-phosphate oxidase family protein [Microvirga puerhi]|uniref:Pyridoxamine 5'-phosphate oxidase family protein n=1 Tax=Microvirga puerhi TaxID=2876078 RepID=A0ABS7VI47_9HYPH|nr:pyridoxamine 5'-phosphate oxidase family protein [Microvirga puerhi]MBZ6075179.1 pyridoxamine 5'-phosphate oxidase family protein [Microvirga puerhi]
MDETLKRQILDIFNRAKHMTLATIREDGYPQATTVSFASNGLALYFGCAAQSQKAQNIAFDGRVSATVNLPYQSWDDIRGLSLAGRAELLADPTLIREACRMLVLKFPQLTQYATEGLEGVAIYRITPEVFSVLDYRKGFGHTEFATVSDETRSRADEIVEEADLESFPASDPPSWTGTSLL